MACCAFALYLLSQLLLPLRWVRDRLWGEPAATGSAAVGWSPAAAVAALPRPRRRLAPLLGLVLLAEAAGVAAAAAGVLTPAPVAAQADFLTALHSSICSAAKRTLS